MTPSPLISVALCTWNGAGHLREQLDSILGQRGVTLELVALDDASTDGTVAILQEYAARDPRVQIHRNAENLGHLRSFEACMRLCRGEFIAPADQDDIWDPDKLRILLDAIGDADLAYCDSEYIDSDGRPIGRKVSDDLTMHQGRDPVRYLFQNTVSGHAALLRPAVLADALPFPAQLYHDWWLAIRAAAGHGVVYVDRPLVKFRRHGGAASALGKTKPEADTRTREERKRDRLATGKNRKWIEERAYVAKRYGETTWLGHERGTAWHRVFTQSLAGNRRELWDTIWHDRHSVPPWSGHGTWNAIRFWFRCRRKLQRAAQEPVPTTPIFRA